MAYVYMLWCAHGRLYTGITTDIARRIDEHRGRGRRGAKFTRANPVCSLAALWESEDLRIAARIEYRIKRLSAHEKRALAAEPGLLGQAAFPLPDGVMCKPIPLPHGETKHCSNV